MARVHPPNQSSQLPDHVDERHRNPDSAKKASYVDVIRGGGGVRAGGGRGGGGGGGGGRGEHVRRCYRCDDPGHIIRDCPFPGFSTYDARKNGRRGNQASVNDPVKVDARDFTSGAEKVRTKPVNSSLEVSTNFETVTPVLNELPPNPLLAKIQQKERELQLRDQEIDSLNSKLNKVTTELNLCQVKNEEMVVDMKKLQDDLEKSRKELSYLRDKDEEMNMKWWALNNEFVETKGELNEKIKELEEANESADFEVIKLKLETEQWRKAAKAITSVLVEGADICCKAPELESLVLYYSNRAAKRMSLGKIRKALDDCKKATQLDPGFLKVSLTAGNCHLVLGNIDDALYNYKRCLDSGVVCLDRRLAIDASDGLQNAEKVVSYINRLAELLQHKTSESAITALEVVNEALSISRYSEKLLEMKGEALFMLHKYEEVIQMCEQTLTVAENNNCATLDDNGKHTSDEDKIRLLKLWRWNLMSRSYFHTAKFDVALDTLEKYEQLAPSETKTQGPSSLSFATISELLRCKNAGNKAFKGGKYREAVEHYTTAIMQSVESKSFTAICLCNRAAALQALGEVTDAIADCNIAIALDGDYMKAISRRAKLHEKIRDYEHAAIDFQRLISLLEKKSGMQDDLTVARRNLSSLKKNMKKGATLDLYLILGLKGSESGSEIKKAYHKAALRHHPDKAGKFLARSESGLDGHVWKEIFTTIHKDANKLFKMIGEAYSVLSDTNKRFDYNLQDTTDDDFGWSHGWF